LTSVLLPMACPPYIAPATPSRRDDAVVCMLQVLQRELRCLIP
jgi:hypothetical protein